jgi:heterotetrameric sarcosine oxidase delta subunit
MAGKPTSPALVHPRPWSRYLFERGNPRGIHLERWHHGFGCQRWFNVARDTRSHRIHVTYAMTDPPPAMPDGEDTP